MSVHSCNKTKKLNRWSVAGILTRLSTAGSCCRCADAKISSAAELKRSAVRRLLLGSIPAASITQSEPILTLLFLLLSAEKPMPQGPPGGVIGILGGVVAIGLIIGVAVTVFMVHRRQHKTRTETDNDL